MTCVVREAKSGDEEGILKLLHELQNYEIKLHPGRRPWKAKDPRAYYQAVMRRLKAGGGKVYVAEMGKKLVGLIMGWIENDRHDLLVRNNEKRYGFIGETVVTKSARRKGVYDALAEKMESYLFRKGVKRVRTRTLGKNYAMQSATKARNYSAYELVLEKSRGRI